MEKVNPLDYINKMFPTEASLSGVEPLMQKVHNEIRVVDAEILTAVRQQSNSGSKAKEDLAAATSAVKELMYKVREIKSKAEQSETMVQEICRDIKKLDFAKKHITTTITALHRLTMLGQSSVMVYNWNQLQLFLVLSGDMINSCLNVVVGSYDDDRRLKKDRDSLQEGFNHLWTQLEDILENLKEKPDVATLLTALQRTIEFEEELAEKFGGGGSGSSSSRNVTDAFEETDKSESNDQIVLDIRKKYEKKLAAHQGNQDDDKDIAVPGAGVFINIKRSLKRCSALTKNQTLLNLFKVFQRVLRAYATKIYMKLPKGGTGIVAAATGMDGQIKTSDKDERMICYIVNTAEYCHDMAEELAENVSKIIDTQLADAVDMSAVQVCQ
nr:vacuolar protein sorting-associated protein 53 A [Tanacetum cinerariifolium]